MNPAELVYTKEHEWVRLDDDAAVVGITDYAQKELGHITFLELPEVGRQVQQQGELAVVESVKAASDILAPINGVVESVNKTLEDEPEIINRDPYGDGWICRLVNYDEDQARTLMTAREYEEYIRSL